MSKKINTDFELIKDINNLIEKYGVERICDVLDYITNEDNNKEIIMIIKKIASICKLTNKEDSYFADLEEHEKKKYKLLISMFSDKHIFSNTKKLDEFISSYGLNIVNYKTKKEKVIQYARSIIKNGDIDNIILELDRMKSDKYIVKSENQLEKWAGLIIDDKKDNLNK